MCWLLWERNQKCNSTALTHLTYPGIHFLFLTSPRQCDSGQTKRFQGCWWVYGRQHTLPLIRQEIKAWRVEPRGGWDGVCEGWVTRWKHCWGWVIWCISATQNTEAVNLNSYVTGPLKTSIRSYRRHIRVTWETQEIVCTLHSGLELSVLNSKTEHNPNK